MKTFRFDSNLISITEAMVKFDIHEKLMKAEKEGSPGMCIGQMQTDGIVKISFVDHETALKLQLLLGGKEFVGKKGYL